MCLAGIFPETSMIYGFDLDTLSILTMNFKNHEDVACRFCPQEIRTPEGRSHAAGYIQTT